MNAEDLAKWYMETFPMDILIEFKKHTDICDANRLNTTAFGGINYSKSTGNTGMPKIFGSYNKELPFKPANTTYRQVIEIAVRDGKMKRLLHHVRTLK